MKTIINAFLIAIAIFVSAPVTAQKKDTANAYTNLKKGVKDVANGVVADAKEFFTVLPGDSSYNKLADTSKATFTTVYKDLRAGIVGMAQALKVGAEHVYQILVRQQIAKSIYWLVLFIFTFVVFKLAWKTSSKENWKTSGDSVEPKNGWAILSVVFWVIGCVMLLFCVFHIDTIVYGFTNPEYGAMTDIVDFVKKIKGGQTQ